MCKKILHILHTLKKGLLKEIGQILLFDLNVKFFSQFFKKKQLRYEKKSVFFSFLKFYLKLKFKMLKSFRNLRKYSLNFLNFESKKEL